MLPDERKELFLRRSRRNKLHIQTDFFHKGTNIFPVFATKRYLCGVKHPVELFSELGRRLRDFGSDASTRPIIRRACEANGWFTPDDIRRAVAALCDEMLQPHLLEAWLRRYPLPVSTPRRVLVVMAGNIPLVGFFDLLCVVAAGHRCLVKPASKDRVLMEYVVGLLHELDPETAPELYDGCSSVDAVIATGGDNARRHFKARYAGIPTLLRGHRQSVAVLAGNETAEQLAALADDIWAYSGLGCRSVSMLFLPEGYDPPLEMPAVNDKYRNNYRQTAALLEMTGQPYRDLGGAVLVEQPTFPTHLSRIACARYRSPGEVEAWLADHDAELQCVVSACVDHSRRVGFGRAQAPSLTDYPDARDVMRWLAALDRPCRRKG